jgi:hypothetical protein
MGHVLVSRSCLHLTNKAADGQRPALDWGIMFRTPCMVVYAKEFRNHRGHCPRCRQRTCWQRLGLSLVSTGSKVKVKICVPLMDIHLQF